MKRNPENRASTLPLQTGLTSSLLQSRHPVCSASQRLYTCVTWEAASRRPRATYVADTAYHVGCCERQRNLNCNVMLPLIFAPQSDDYFCVSMCNYYDYV